MEIRLSEEQEAIRDGVKRVCDQFNDEYWSDCDEQKRFPFEFHRAMADAGWLGIAMCVLGFSGLIMWWPRRGRYAEAFKVMKLVNEEQA